MVAVDIQLSASHCDWPTLRDASLVAESVGYDALWVFDHLGGVALSGSRNVECFTWLGALTQLTSRIELGVLVANASNRQVGTLAVAAASVAELSSRRFWLGIGAGASPNSPWAAEQVAVGAELLPALADRHARVEQFLDLTDEMWRRDRPEPYSSFPLPTPPPPRIIGVNSVALSHIAGRRAEGINVRWDHPRRDDFIATARAAAGDREFAITTWVTWAPDLLDPTHPVRVEMDERGVDRVILTVVSDVAAFARLSRPSPSTA